MQARIIIAHLVHQPFPTWQPSLVLLVLIGSAITAAHSLHAGSLVTREIDLYLLYGYVAFTGDTNAWPQADAYMVQFVFGIPQQKVRLES